MTVPVKVVAVLPYPSIAVTVTEPVEPAVSEPGVPLSTKSEAAPAATVTFGEAPSATRGIEPVEFSCVVNVLVPATVVATAAASGCVPPVVFP